MAYCPYCTQGLPPESKSCPNCGRVIPKDILDVPPDTQWRNAAIYTLETASKCPICREAIHTVRVIRMTRTHVPFTSTLPRGGRAFVCPHCEAVITIELGSLP
jgi:transposase